MRVTKLRIVRVGVGMALAAGVLTAVGPACRAGGFEDSGIPQATAADGVEASEVILGGESWGEDGAEGPGFDAGGPIADGQCPPGADCRPGARCGACDPPYGMFNRLIDNKHACWTFRTDAMFLWREAPRVRPLSELIAAGVPVPDANQLNSPLAAGPRFSIFRTNGCGDALEATYFRAANWNAVNAVAGPTETFTATLGAAAQSFELNGRTTICPAIQLLGGFRWFEWRENLYAVDSVTSPVVASTPLNIGTINDLYGYQIGFDSLLFSSNWLRVEALMKGGAYLNTAAMSCVTDTAFGPYNSGAAGKAASFVGELGMTGVMPLSRNIDFRFGYIALWLQGLAQPTNQYRAGKPDPAVPAVIDLTGGTVLQGLTLGLEGRW